MWSSPQLLGRLKSLGETGFKPAFTVGSVVARGFADLGVEEFLVLPGERLLSLMSGTVAPIPEEHRDFFFAVLSDDQLDDELDRAGYRIVSIAPVSRRGWEAVIEHDENGERRTYPGGSIREALVECLRGVRSGS